MQGTKQHPIPYIIGKLIHAIHDMQDTASLASVKYELDVEAYCEILDLCLISREQACDAATRLATHAKDVCAHHHLCDMIHATLATLNDSDGKLTPGRALSQYITTAHEMFEHKSIKDNPLARMAIARRITIACTLLSNIKLSHMECIYARNSLLLLTSSSASGIREIENTLQAIEEK